MNIDQVFSWILTHKQNYPGRHQEPQPRTTEALRPLETKSQLHVIFKAMVEYIRENISSGKSVNIRGFGAFTFEIIPGFVKPSAFHTIDFTKTLDENREERMNVHKYRPCFVVDPQLRYHLPKYQGKEEMSMAKSQRTVYEKGFGMIFCNPATIAAACYLGREVVASALQAIVLAIIDLTRLGYDLDLDFGFCRVKIYDKNITYAYKREFAGQLNQTGFSKKIKKSTIPTSSFWKSSSQEKWAKSTLGSLYKVPELVTVRTINEKVLALKIMSMDLNTTEKTYVARPKIVTLPKIEPRKGTNTIL